MSDDGVIRVESTGKFSACKACGKRTRGVGDTLCAECWPKVHPLAKRAYRDAFDQFYKRMITFEEFKAAEQVLVDSVGKYPAGAVNRKEEQAKEVEKMRAAEEAVRAKDVGETGKTFTCHKPACQNTFQWRWFPGAGRRPIYCEEHRQHKYVPVAKRAKPVEPVTEAVPLPVDVNDEPGRESSAASDSIHEPVVETAAPAIEPYPPGTSLVPTPPTQLAAVEAIDPPAILQRLRSRAETLEHNLGVTLRAIRAVEQVMELDAAD